MRVPGGARTGGNTPDEQCSEGADEGLFFHMKNKSTKKALRKARGGAGSHARKCHWAARGGRREPQAA
ncbi:hypothetical protein M23134_08473 [Microscilla marina ATCC 23134]|uniref:Uncharacterized protein n=1 Tax=Microscilla marina ATCC 23134 TaxID=313606 RepID=A2A0N3_MICM2|nr:hypothetical protein M23134_08479 [Microscilla marina ATCC 23134]EAY23806.1 hypothetical protein M23134_08473 [Microscilla marina ATCC 23134]